MAISIRPADPDDGPALRRIERDAGERFRGVGMSDIADHEPPSVERLADYAAAGRSWVAVDDDGAPIGYVLCEIVGGDAHVEQVSVHPAWQGRGVGRALMDHVSTWAIAHGHRGVTLTTFTDVPWNAPWYQHLGFRSLDDHELPDALRAVRDEEATHGLDPARRVCMRLELPDRDGGWSDRIS